MRASFYFLLPLCLGILISCQEKDPAPEATLPPTGCDGDLMGTDCQQFFVAEGETLSYPAGTKIIAADGIEINGDIVIDPAASGDFTLTATSGDIVIRGKILVKDTASGNSSGGRYKNGKNASRLKNGKAADGFTLTLDARGPNGNIILKKGATLFSGRGQHALDEVLATLTDYHEGEVGGNGGLIILNAPNGKIILPDLSNPVTPYQDELFVLGNGGNGANVDIDDNLETANPEVMEVRGGLGGNSGHLIIDAPEIEGIPALEAMQTHPDFIYGGEGGQGGNAFWKIEETDKKYTFREIILYGGEGGAGAKSGGDGGFTIFFNDLQPIIEIGNPIPNVFCYGGDGGDVFASPLPHQSVWGGNGGAYGTIGIRGWNGGEDAEGNLFRDGADGGNVLGQGGNGGNILASCRANLAVGGNGSFSDPDRTALPGLFGHSEFLGTFFRLVAGFGGNGYGDCEGCRGGNGGNAGTATAIGGKGGEVLGEAIQSVGGDGGDTWAIVRGVPGNGGKGNPPGKAGSQPSNPFLFDHPGEGGNGTTAGSYGETLGFNLNGDILGHGLDGETCGEDLECEEEENDPHEEGLLDCLEPGTTRPRFGSKFISVRTFAYPLYSDTRVMEGTFLEKDGTSGWWVKYTDTHETSAAGDSSYVRTYENWLGPNIGIKNIFPSCNGTTFNSPAEGSCCGSNPIESWLFSGCNPATARYKDCYRCESVNGSTTQYEPVWDPEICKDDG